MTDLDETYGRRLRRDVPTGMAAFLCLLALLLPTIGVVTLLVKGPQIEARGNPLYWLILAIPAAWAWRMMDYTPGALRSIRPALLIAPFIAGVVITAAAMRGSDLIAYEVMLGLTCLLSATGGLLYDRSLLACEGPAR